MKRYSAAVAAVAIFATACSGGADVAATVNGTDIAAADVESLVYEIGDDFGDAEFTRLLETLVLWTAIGDAAKSQYGLDPTDDEIATEVQRIHAQEGAGADFDQFLVAQNISEGGLDLYAKQILIGEGILAELEATVEQPTEAAALALLDENPGAWTEVCAAHILVATEEEAAAVLERLDSGEEFAALAVELSTDTTSGAAGGGLGCRAPSGPTPYVEEFAAATMTGEVGTVVGPVATQFGFHLIRIDSRTEAATAELVEGLAQIQVSEVIDEWYVSSIGGADVEVAAEWGTWTTDPFPGIAPPAELVP